MNARGVVLFAALAGAAWLALFGDRTPVDSIATPSPPRAIGVDAVTPNTTTELATATTTTTSVANRSAASPTTSFETPIPRDQLIADNSARRPRDLFAGRSWAPPSAPVVQAAPEPVVPAGPPPLPFTYLGKKWEADRWEVYLGQNDQNLIVRIGSTIEDRWRVDRIDPPTLAVTYLPSGQTQTLAIGEPQ